MKISLVELPYLKWHNLRDLYVERKKEPSSYALLQNYIDWKLKEPTMNVKIYALSNNWASDGTFILIDADIKTPHIYFNTLEKDSQWFSLMLNCLSFKSNYFLSTLSSRNLPIVKQFLFERGSAISDVKYFGGNWYHLSKKEALNFIIKPPVGIFLSKLKQSHVEQIHNVWPHRGADTIKYVSKLINLNESVGAFDSNQNLLAWCLRTPLGALGNVQVLETHKRLGLGSLVVRYMAKNLALKNEEVMAPVKYDNFASRSMFEKLGFKAIDEAFCVEIPKDLGINILCTS